MKPKWKPGGKNSIEKCFSLLWYLLSTAFCHKLACGQIVKLNQKWSRIDIFALNKENRLNQIFNLQNLPYAWERQCSVIASENNKSCFIVEINLWMTSHSNIIANVVRIFIFFLFRFLYVFQLNCTRFSHTLIYCNNKNSPIHIPSYTQKNGKAEKKWQPYEKWMEVNDDGKNATSHLNMQIRCAHTVMIAS